MSAIGFLVLLVIAIIALMLLMTKAKLNPVMSLFVVALGFGVTLGIFGTEGYSFMETLTLITTGFGNTLGSLGMPIILGAVLAMGVQDTGAAKSIANFFIRLFRGKNLELAPSLTAYVVSIPVFGDITTILCSNIANVLGKRKHISMSTMASFTQTGLNLTHAMVPPTPGILAVSVALSADLGMVISWGIVITVITFFLTWLILKRWTAKEWIPAVPAVTAEIKETSSDEVSDLIIKDKDLPNTFASFLTILIPVILIAGGSFVGMLIPESTPDDAMVRTLVAIASDKVVALSMGVIYTMFLALAHKASVRKSNLDATGKDPQSFREVVLNSWPADSVPGGCHHDDRRGFHDDRRRDRRWRCGSHDGSAGPGACLHRSGHRSRYPDFQPCDQLRFLGCQQVLQSGPEAGLEVHHHPGRRGRCDRLHLCLHPGLRRSAALIRTPAAMEFRLRKGQSSAA